MVCLLGACNVPSKQNTGVIDVDSVQILKKQLVIKDITIKKYQDSLYRCYNSVENAHNEFRLNKIRRYIDLVNKNPTNAKFFQGWVTRVMNE